MTICSKNPSVLRDLGVGGQMNMRIIIVTAVLLLALVAALFYPTIAGTTNGEEMVYLQDGRVFKKIEVNFLLAEFSKNGITNTSHANGKIQIPKSTRSRCNEIVQGANLEKLDKKNSSSNSIINPFMSPSAKVELAKKEKLEDLESILARISGIREAVIVHDQAKGQGFNRKTIHTAFVTLWAKEGQVISQLHASTARKMVKRSFADMDENDVLVVDGDTGLTFSLDNESSTEAKIVESQVDLETTRQEFEIQCKKLISQFGESEVKVRMDLEKRTITMPPQIPSATNPNLKERGSSEVVANGKGEISSKTLKETPSQNTPLKKTVLIKRLFGIDVTIEKKVVEEYVRQNIGGAEEISEDQFTRGIVSVRNEITKAIVLWLRSQQGIDVNSDVVSVAVVQGDTDQSPAETVSTTGTESYLSFAIFGAIAVVVVMFFVLATIKSRSPTPRTSRENRTIENRNPEPVESMAGESPNHPHTESNNGSRSFSNILSSETS